jgi:hypothetical protein
MSELPPKARGEGRVRTNVSRGKDKRAAIAVLKTERRPTVEAIERFLDRYGDVEHDELTKRTGAGSMLFSARLAAQIDAGAGALPQPGPDGSVIAQ